ncbi:MAG: hypothetical protein WC775_06500 [Patescibacteria group bacterium]|jgi:hypothetical protein
MIKKIFKQSLTIFFGGLLASVCISPVLVIYHFQTGLYSYLLDGVILEDLIGAIRAYVLLLTIGSIFTTSFFFLVVFLVFLFLNREKNVNINQHILVACSGFFTGTVFVFGDLVNDPQEAILSIRLLSFAIISIILNWFAFFLSEKIEN